MKFNELIENVKGWSTAKELDKASPLSQMLKLNEEWGELNGATVRKDKSKGRFTMSVLWFLQNDENRVAQKRDYMPNLQANSILGMGNWC